MSHAEVHIKQVIADVFGEPLTAISDDSSIDTIATWDSLRHLNLVVALEERFEVQFSEEETLEILSYELIRAVLQDHGISFTSPESP